MTTEPALDLAVLEPDPRRLGRRRLYARRFVRNRGALVGSVIFLLLLLFTLFGGMTTKYSYTSSDFTALSAEPGGSHYFGTTVGGGDVYAQVVHGLQRSLTIAIAVSVLTLIISALIGSLAAYLGGVFERVALAVIHFLLVVPSFLILALISNHAAGDWRVLILVLTAFGWMLNARVIWSMSASLRERDYVHVAEFMGVKPLTIVIRHIIPNLGAILVLNLTLGVVGTVLSETALSFLGFGIKAPDVSLGSLLSDGTSTITTAPWIIGFPSLVLVLLTVSLTLVGDGLRDAVDPSSRPGSLR
jgi:peptide/nickel transport system permease protein